MSIRNLFTLLTFLSSIYKTENVCMFSVDDHSLRPIATKIVTYTRHVKREVFVNKLDEGFPFEGLTFSFGKSCIVCKLSGINDYLLIVV